jgi:hypothetical protein
MASLDASRAVSVQLHRVRWFLHAHLLETKLRALRYAVKANFDPNQPRVPAGHPEGGQWTGTGAGTQVAQNDPPDRLTNIPEERPASARLRNIVIKIVASEVATILRLREELRGSIGYVLDLLEVASWVREAIPLIQSYADPPMTLEELQQAVSLPTLGYNIHHIVEQTLAEQDGFPRSMIDSPENLVRIPTLKHWQVTGWYMTGNEDFGGLPPRDYLRGKDWETRVRVGLEALIKHGVLKP